MRAHQWPDGTVISVFVLPDTDATHHEFTRKILSLFPYQLRRSWDRYVYSGIGIAPIEVENQKEMIEKVGATPGGIGYISKEVTNENIRTLLVK